MESKTKGMVILYHLFYVLFLEMILTGYVFELSWYCFKTMLLPLLLNLGCNNFVETPMYENYLWTCYNMWLVVLNHVRSWFVCRFVWDPSWFHQTTGFIWVQIWPFERFGDCYCTCALVNWTVLLQEGLGLTDARGREMLGERDRNEEKNEWGWGRAMELGLAVGVSHRVDYSGRTTKARWTKAVHAF